MLNKVHPRLFVCVCVCVVSAAFGVLRITGNFKIVSDGPRQLRLRRGLSGMMRVPKWRGYRKIFYRQKHW